MIKYHDHLHWSVMPSQPASPPCRPCDQCSGAGLRRGSSLLQRPGAATGVDNAEPASIAPLSTLRPMQWHNPHLACTPFCISFFALPSFLALWKEFTSSCLWLHFGHPEVQCSHFGGRTASLIQRYNDTTLQ